MDQENKFSIERTVFGEVDGEVVYQYVIKNAEGVSFTSVSYGATVISIKTPDRFGEFREITLCRDNLEDLKTKSRYFGAIAGRYANRIRLGKFSLDGVEYQLPINNGVNSLHGGIRGFDKRVWTSTVFMEGKSAGVRYTYVSADGEEGYPGELTVSWMGRRVHVMTVTRSFYLVGDCHVQLDRLL
jgi:aldose 1-epimerase